MRDKCSYEFGKAKADKRFSVQTGKKARGYAGLKF